MNTSESKLLNEAHSIQDLTGKLIAMRDAGDGESEAFNDLIETFVARRRHLVSESIEVPVDALIVINLLQQAAQAVFNCADCANPDAFRFWALELLLAAKNLLPFMEAQAGTTLAELHLHPGPTAGTVH